MPLITVPAFMYRTPSIEKPLSALCFPVLDKRLKKRVIEEGLKAYLADNTDAWEMDANGRYKRRMARGTRAVSAQGKLLERLASQVA